MLGAASEQMVLLLISSHASSIRDPAEKSRFAQEIEKSQSIFRKYQVFERRLSGIQINLPRPLSDNLDSLLRGVFDLIRSSRNDAGHPASGVQIGRDAVYSHLRLFVPYCQRINELARWFSSNQT